MNTTIRYKNAVPVRTPATQQTRWLLRNCHQSLGALQPCIGRTRRVLSRGQLQQLKSKLNAIINSLVGSTYLGILPQAALAGQGAAMWRALRAARPAPDA